MSECDELQIELERVTAERDEARRLLDWRETHSRAFRKARSWEEAAMEEHEYRVRLGQALAAIARGAQDPVTIATVALDDGLGDRR